MANIIIYGASDDLIEIEGSVREEFSPSYGDPILVAVSDGTLLRVSYDGMWTIRRLIAGSADYEHVEASYEDENYSDRVALTGDIKWITCANEWVAVKS